MKYLSLLSSFAICFVFSSSAQMLNKHKENSKADSLRGTLTPLRTCYDINYYHLDVKIDIANKSVSGSNEFAFTATQDFSKLQFDLFSNLTVEKVVYKNQNLPFTRAFDAVFVTFPMSIKKGTREKFTVFYSGNPIVAVRPPWDGGFIFDKDVEGNPFVSVACQGLGASVWYPNKDHQSDEVDSALISISVPDTLDGIANGRLRSKEKLGNGYTKYNWFVSEPINNYNIAFYIGKYAHWQDTFAGEKGNLSIDYWSLKTDSAKARPHWDADVKTMLKAFEHWFGPYPWYKDGYKLVQAPHLGMEHQSAVAYGNRFMKGYLGKDLSGTGYGLKWDFIIVHESGHEWFGNNITSKDLADMWIHEGFTNYSETLFIDYTQGTKEGNAYVQGLRKGILNDKPIIGPYGVNKEGSGDMYNKGGNMIHTIRQLIDNDEKFKQILRGLNKTFYHQTVTSAQIENYISAKSGLKLNKVFDKYLRNKDIPTLQYAVKDGTLKYRWAPNSDVKVADKKADGPAVTAEKPTDFDMPVKVTLKKGSYDWIKPTGSWKFVKVGAHVTNETFEEDPNFYIFKKRVNY